MRTADGFMVPIGGTVYDQNGCEWEARDDGVYRKEPVYNGMTSNRYGWGDLQHAETLFFSTVAAAVRSQIMELTDERKELDERIAKLTDRLFGIAVGA